MKLSAHYNKASIIISVSVLLISGIVYYTAINRIAKKQLDDNLREEVEEVLDYVHHNGRFPKEAEFDEDQTTFIKTDQNSFKTQFFDAIYTDHKLRRDEQGRAVATLIPLHGQNYICTIIVSRESTEYLIQVISAITLLLTALLLLVLTITNKYILNGLWRPFYYILDHVKTFNLTDQIKKIDIVESPVDEFQELNHAVSTMSSRVSSDYQGLKAFTENASHEMITPIAVITSKLDTLIQDERLESGQLSQITDVYAAISKLSRINQSLILLVKIDNNLIQEREIVALKPILLEKAQQFQEIIGNKNILLELVLEEAEVKASKYLIDILIGNLFSNSIRHNKPGGKIIVGLHHQQLTFQNSGEDTPLQQERIFSRFYKGRNSDGIGLGLAVVDNICSKYGFYMKYHFAENLHNFSVNFNTEKGLS
ncbi:sensor histidine kinase [Mucilaginibacter sp.]|uniref:sensor histidine kinase n=1 Tax=Mucilaginibacter sp. TaxID=1882438 RepID=UPI003AFF72A9